ncbi:MAG: DUF2330 domain-containing protein [Pseudomonadota bacterium]
MIRNITCFFCFVMFLPGQLLADGVMYRTTGGSVDVKATAQRAIMWHREGRWEIHIQPQFEREKGSAAWVVPFPVKPTVHEGNEAFFSDLELITSPMFAETCYESHSSFGCMGAEDTGANKGGNILVGESGVKVWEHSEVGDLEYVILSAEEGEDLGAWLEKEGFELPPGADDLLSIYNAEGAFFFVARQSAKADPQKPLAPVRFVLLEMETPTYPLRMTALGASATEKLDLTIWVIVSSENYQDYFVPGSHPFRELNFHPRSRQEFDAALDSFFATFSSETFVVLSSLQSYDIRSVAVDGRVNGGYHDITFSDLGIDAPASWSPELFEIGRREQGVFRYQARLSADAMAKDLTLGLTTSLPYVQNVYIQEMGACDDLDSDCSMSKKIGLHAWWPIAFLVLVMIVLRRKRRKK